MKRIACLALCLVLAGCASPPNEPPPNPQFGVPPIGYAELAKIYLRNALVNPDGAIFGVPFSPQKGYFNDLNTGQNIWYGWFVYLDVNAKDAQGRYLGLRRHVVLFKGGQPVATHPKTAVPWLRVYQDG